MIIEQNVYFEKIAEIIKLREKKPPETLETYLNRLRDKQIVLYGAGAFGQENYDLFVKYGLKPLVFLDRNAKPGQTKKDIPVLHPESESLSKKFREECFVFISITLPKAKMNGIKADLSQWGYLNCSEVQKITARQVKFDDTPDENPGNDYIDMSKEKIFHAAGLMSDKESCETYLSSIKAHLSRDYESCVETEFPAQYFDAGVPYKKNFSHFVDCGAYNGDSARAVLQFTGTIAELAAFEPIPENYLALSKNIDDLKNKIGRAYLYPCGAAERTGSARFSISASSSGITENSDGELFPIVKIDDALKNFPVSFLKMDIEGAEPAALRGAKNLIREFKPDMAISVYHAVNHFWDIPCIIDEMCGGYRFYLRAHTPATLETVLYAINEDK